MPSVREQLIEQFGLPATTQAITLSVEGDGEPEVQVTFTDEVGAFRRYVHFTLGGGATWAAPRLVRCGWGTVDPETAECWDLAGNVITLTKTERGIMRVLAQRPDRVTTFYQLNVGVWGIEYADDSRELVRVHVSRIRRKLGDVPPWQHIRTIHGGGLVLASARRSDPPRPAEELRAHEAPDDQR